MEGSSLAGLWQQSSTMRKIILQLSMIFKLGLFLKIYNFGIQNEKGLLIFKLRVLKIKIEN